MLKALVERDSIAAVLHRLAKRVEQQNAAIEPVLNIACRDIAHVTQVVLKVFADGVTLHVVVVQGE